MFRQIKPNLRKTVWKWQIFQALRFYVKSILAKEKCESKFYKFSH